MKKNITPNKIDLNNFMESAKIIAETCIRFSYADVDYCADERGNKCPFSQKGGCIFAHQWAVFPCELLRRNIT